MGLKIVGIGGKDIYEKNKKLIQGFIWQLMWRDVEKTLGKINEE